MATAKQHDDAHLADFYLWMMGDFDAKQQKFKRFLEDHDVLPGPVNISF